MLKEKVAETTQYLTFRLGDERFALNVSQVREVLDVLNVTRVPRAPLFMRGVINVRGSVVPVADLRMKFGMSRTENTVNTRIIVMELMMEGEKTILGAMADQVHEVMELAPEQIDHAPRIGARWRTEYIKGVGKRDDRFIIILDIDRIFSADEPVLAERDDEEKSGA